MLSPLNLPGMLVGQWPAGAVARHRIVASCLQTDKSVTARNQDLCALFFIFSVIFFLLRPWEGERGEYAYRYLQPLPCLPNTPHFPHPLLRKHLSMVSRDDGKFG